MDYDKLVQLAQDLKNRVDKLERENQSLRVANNVARELFESPGEVTESDVQRTISITIPNGGGTDTAEVLDYPDLWFPINSSGKRYRVPVYNL